MFNDMRQRREAKPPPDALAETTGRDENQAPDPLRALEEEHLRNTTAKGVTDDIRPLEPDRLEPPSDDTGVPVELIAGVRALGLPVTWEVEHQHTSIHGQESRHG
jgi:hypothetical protein